MEKENYIIKEVTEHDDCFSISTTQGIGFVIYKKYGVIPKAGDTVALYIKDFSSIRGIDLNGNPLFYKTDEQLEEDRQKWLKENEEKKQKEFAENVHKMDGQYNNLPDFFKQRIDRFRNNNKRFRIDYESYELFCCEQAVVIANACKTAEEVQLFHKKPYKEQRKQVAGLSDQHSGNTFGCACSLAYQYLLNPENVVKMYGALSPLVGSDEYGDFPKDDSKN